jgi:hypothetical protein
MLQDRFADAVVHDSHNVHPPAGKAKLMLTAP